MGAIPCLNYRRAIEEEETDRSNQKSAEEISAIEEEAVAENNTAKVSKCPFGKVDASADVAIGSSQFAQVSSTNGKENDLSEPAATPISDTLTAATSTSVNTADLAANVAALKSLVPPAKIVTVTENTQKESLTPEQLNQYCGKLFKFKVIRVLRFRSWNARRKFTKNRKHIKNLQRPTLPDGTKLIKFPILAPSGDTNANTRGRKEWIMNPNGKSYVCILHEYVQHALKKQPTYEFKELENAATPYSATVSINDLKYGTGYGTSKKQAKSDAARETLEILIPEMKDKITGIKQDKNVPKNSHKDLSVSQFYFANI